MKILGIDPGTHRIGYGVLENSSHGPRLCGAGLLPLSQTKSPQLLLEIRKGLLRLIRDYRPDCAAVEELYFSKNRTTAIRVAEARGVILLTLAEAKIPIREYAPTTVKSRVAGYGGADKRAVLKVVRLLLHSPNLAIIDDASDALALAFCALGDSRAPS